MHYAFSFFTIFIVILRTKKAPNLQIGYVDISNIKDGVYVGSANNGFVTATVSVEVNNGMILSITILEHEQLLGKKS